ncbi:MAG: NADH-quinone oxidoreductase subunit J [Candidatus Dasytiphilus stammeri]
MEVVFYLCGTLSIFTILRVITHTNPMYALFYLLISILLIAGIFFCVGADFAGALEIIVYAGAIMVLFVFITMMLNMNVYEVHNIKLFQLLQVWLGPLIIIILFVFLFAIHDCEILQKKIIRHVIDVQTIGLLLYGPYLIILEFTSMLLLTGIIVAFHFSYKVPQK